MNLGAKAHLREASFDVRTEEEKIDDQLRSGEIVMVPVDVDGSGLRRWRARRLLKKRRRMARQMRAGRKRIGTVRLDRHGVVRAVKREGNFGQRVWRYKDDQ